MTELRNLTPHPVTVVHPRGTLQLPACAAPPRVSESAESTTQISVSGAVVDVTDLRHGEVVGLPAPVPDVLLVVASVIALAQPDRTDLVVPHTMIRDPNGVVVGCRALARLRPAGN